VDEFLRLLQKSSLLTPEQWKSVRQEVARAARDRAAGKPGADGAAPASLTPAELVEKLVKRGFITPWQAEKLLEGKKAFTVGKYKLVDRVGTGGMGHVFKAVHGDMGRTVALKIMLAETIQNREAVARFRKEIQAVAALDDPHIVAAYDAGTFGAGLNYLVMEFVDGHDLGYLLEEEGPLPVGWACECIRQAALGLQYVHEKGMVHRDIKPTNILVAKDPESDRPLVKILDLGLARFISETTSADTPSSEKGGRDGSLTQFGQLLGTPDYIAPEQGQNVQAADIRSDIFSLGCTLFRVLTGQFPFAGETVLQKLEAREKTDALRLKTLRPDVPAELDAVVARMLARDPKLRYQTPREVAQALAPFTTQFAPFRIRPRKKPADAKQPNRPLGEETRLDEIFKGLADVESDQSLSVAGITTRLKRVTPRYWLAAAGLALLVAASSFVWGHLSAATLVIDWPDEQREGAELRVNQRRVPISNGSSIAAKGNSGTWRLSLARDGYETIDETLTLRRGERRAYTPAWRPTARTLRRAALQKLEKQVEARAPLDVSSSPAVALRADLLSFLREHPTSPEAHTARQLASRLRWPLDLLDGRDVPDGLDFALQTGNPQESSVRPVGIFGDGRLNFWNRITAVAVSDDGRLIVGASLDGTVRVLDAADGKTRHIIVPPIAPTALAFSPKGAILAIVGRSGPVTLWNAAEGTIVATLPDTAGPTAFIQDGSLIAVQAARQEIALFDPSNGELRRTLHGHATGILEGLTFSHQGKMLASYGGDSSVFLWDVASGQERRRFPNARQPLFSPDDTYLAAGSTNGDLVLWDTRTGETKRTFDDGGYPLAFDSTGEKVVSKRPGRAVVWDMATGEEIRTIIEVPELAAVSPDGNWLAGADDVLGELVFWNLSGGPRRSVSTAGPVDTMEFVSDSSALVAGTRDHVVQTVAVDSGTERPLASWPVAQADLSPDGRWLALRQGDQVDLVDVTTGQTVRTLAGSAADLVALAFSPDGRLIAGFGGWGFFKTSLRLWDTTDGHELSLAGEPLGSVRALSFSADSQLLACAGESRLVTVWNVGRKEVAQTLDDFPDRVKALAFQPDGRRLAVACHDRSVVLWDLKGASGKSLATQGVACQQLVFSSDGKLLAGAADERVLIWKLESGEEPVELAAGDTTIRSIAFDLAATRLAATGEEGTVWVWNDPARTSSTGQPDRDLRIGPLHGIVNRVIWGPDGRHLLTLNGNGTVYVLQLGGR
jgi:serine/threonine protein kinase/WD40 repeat protein